MAAATARHEIRALLRAHLAAASGYRHLTRCCAVCHRLRTLAEASMELPSPSTPLTPAVPAARDERPSSP